MPQQTDNRPYFFDVYYRLEVGVGRQNEYLSQFHFATIKEAASERDRILSEAHDVAIDFEVSGIRGPDVNLRFVGLTESQRAIMQLRLAAPEEGDPMDEPF